MRARNTDLMPAAPDLAGTALDARYELHALIGEGAFGRVYRGLDRRLARAVAIKVIKPWWAEDDAWVERFEGEARLLARVSDPGIVQIFDIGHAEQGPYYVAELVEGESLAERLQRRAMPIPEAVAVAERLCRALASAHAQGIVHCDVKPANVLLGRDGSVKVGDFGVARLAGGGTSQALSATVAGTPRYMAPEQARGRRTTPATDVYSAGVVLYEMLAGEPPFVHGTPVQLGLRHLQDRPPPLSASIPPALREIVARALRKDPEMRFADGAAMARALGESGLGRMQASEPPRADRATAGGPAPHGPASEEETAGGNTAATADVAEWGEAATEAIARTRLMPRRGAGLTRGEQPDPAQLDTQRQAPQGVRLHPGAWRRRGLLALGLLAAPALAALLVWQLGGSSAGQWPVMVPRLVGQSSASARAALARAGLRERTRLVAAPGTAAGEVTRQSPRAGSHLHHGATVALSVAEQPRWRTLTSFSGTSSARSVPFQIEGRQWRVRYSMSYEGTCTLLLLCFGPSVKVVNLRGGGTLEGFDLSSGSGHGHTFDSGPGLYGVSISSGQDAARWSMVVQDYY